MGTLTYTTVPSCETAGDVTPSRVDSVDTLQLMDGIPAFLTTATMFPLSQSRYTVPPCAGPNAGDATLTLHGNGSTKRGARFASSAYSKSRAAMYNVSSARHGDADIGPSVEYEASLAPELAEYASTSNSVVTYTVPPDAPL